MLTFFQPYHQRLRKYRFHVSIGRRVNIGCHFSGTWFVLENRKTNACCLLRKLLVFVTLQRLSFIAYCHIGDYVFLWVLGFLGHPNRNFKKYHLWNHISHHKPCFQGILRRRHGWSPIKLNNIRLKELSEAIGSKSTKNVKMNTFIGSSILSLATDFQAFLQNTDGGCFWNMITFPLISNF